MLDSGLTPIKQMRDNNWANRLFRLGVAPPTLFSAGESLNVQLYNYSHCSSVTFHL